MACFLKSRETWAGLVKCKRAKLSLYKVVQKTFPTKQEAIKWETDNKDRIRNEIITEHKNKLGIRRAIKMYINGERQEEIKDCFKEIGINISDYLVPTQSIPRTQAEIAKELGITQQCVENTVLPRAYRKARLRFLKINGTPDFDGISDENFFKAFLTTNHKPGNRLNISVVDYCELENAE